MSNRIPERPDVLREKARAHRSAAAAEADPARRRAHTLIALEYDRLAETIESEFNEVEPADERAASRARFSGFSGSRMKT